MFAPVRGYHIDLQSGVYTDEGAWCQLGGDPLDFIMEHRALLNVFDNLDACVGALCGLLKFDMGQLTELKEKSEVTIGGYLFKYYKGRHFSVEYADGRRGFANFLCATLYDENFITIDDKHHKNYCVERARKAKEIGAAAKRAYDSLGWRPTKVSPVTALRDALKDAAPKMPDPALIPEQALVWAYECCTGGWQEAFTLGHWTGKDGDVVFDYDLVSAYPSVASKLLDLDRGHWTEGIMPPEDAEYGYAEVDVNVKSYISPVMWRCDSEISRYTPRGRWTRPMSLQKILFLRKWDLADVNILRGVWWSPTERVYPFRELARDLFRKKTNANGLTKEVVKKGLNGYLYGRWLQYLEKEQTFADDFNPIYAEQVLNRTKLRLAGTCLKHGIEPIHIAVDGFLSPEPIPTPRDNEMGGWKLSYCGKCIIAGTNAVGKDMPKPREFALNYDKLYGMIMKDPDADEWTVDKMHVVGVHDAVAHSKRVGTLEAMRKVVGLGDTKRMYHPLPESGSELLRGEKFRSMPWPVSVLEPMVKSRENLTEQDWWKAIHEEDM